MRNSWVLLIAIIILIVTVLIIVFARPKQKSNAKKPKDCLAFANTKAVRGLPEYKSAKKRYHLLIILANIVFVVSFILTSVLVARPVSVTVAKPQYDTRDIMLCLDVSGSMNSYIEIISNTFLELAEGFEGQRVGITIFDGVYMNVFPLSNDYMSLKDTLNDLKDNLYKYSAGLTSVQESPSEIGPGLVGCVNSFDKLDEEERMRVIILATDNYASDTQAVNLTQAANFAKRHNILVYGLSTSDSRTKAEIDVADEKDEWGFDRYEYSKNKEFRKAILSTGGSYYGISQYKWVGDKITTDSEMVKGIINSVLAQASAYFEGAETLVYSDEPVIVLICLIITISLFFWLVWRLDL